MDDAAHRVVVNDEEQYSIWPTHLPDVPGWHGTGFVGSQQECLDHIEEIWTDLRPRSVRAHLAR
ncbi:MAG: MbtH family protein [Actinobacteria bacterium]|nr:MbtH family protein [Actinomycetota bacterium]